MTRLDQDKLLWKEIERQSRMPSPLTPPIEVTNPFAPDPEIMNYINERSQQAMRRRMLEDERILRAMAIPYIAMGYRIEEMHMLLHEHRFLQPSKDYFGLEPRVRPHKVVLFLRCCWRRFFPYVIPKGTAK